MLQFILKRLLNVPLLLILATLFAFVIVQSGPGNVIDNKPMSANLGPRQVEQYIAEFGLDRPVMVQYVAWLGRVARSRSKWRPRALAVHQPTRDRSHRSSDSKLTGACALEPRRDLPILGLDRRSQRRA